MQDKAREQTDQVLDSITEILVYLLKWGVPQMSTQQLISELLHNSYITYINSPYNPIVYKTEAYAWFPLDLDGIVESCNSS